MNNDDTLEDVEELLKDLRERRSRGQAPSGDEAAGDERSGSMAPTDDETIAVGPQDVGETSPSGWAPSDDDETIDVDPEVLRQLRSAPAAGVLDEDETVVADTSRLADSRMSEPVSGPPEAGSGAHGPPPGRRAPLWMWMAGGLLVVVVMAAAGFLAGWWTSGDDDDTDSHIAFTSGFQLHVMGTGDTTPSRISTGADAIFPVWSPDKTRIAFYGGARPGPFELFVIDSDGSNLLQLTTIGIEGGGLPPIWSPDGTRIAFFGSRELSASSLTWDVLNIVDSDGSDLQRISDGVAYAEWSPDGSQIAFDEVEFLGDGSFDGYVYLMEANGSNVRRLTTSGNDWLVGWLSNGIALARDLVNEDSFDIILIDENGSMIRHLMDLPRDEFILAVSPDDERFLLASIVGDSGELSVIDVDGANRIRLTDDYYFSLTSRPVWSPDGTMVAFTSDRDGDNEVYVIRADGSDLRQLTRNEVHEGIGSWK